MITPIDILIRGNYYITYNFDSKTNISSISFSLDPKYTLSLKYNQSTSTIDFVDGDTSVPHLACSIDAVRAMLSRMLWVYCDELEYPHDMVLYTLDGNRTNRMYYYTGSAPNEAKRDLFYDMYMEIQHDGLNASHLDLAEEYGLWGDLRQLTEDILGIDIGEERL